MKYQAVIFDLFGTLIGNINPADSDNWMQQMAAAVSAPEPEFAREWNATFKKRMTGELYRFQDCVEHVCRELNLPATKAQIRYASKIRFERTRQEMLNPQPQAVETIAGLKNSGHKIALLSNCSGETTMVWDETPLANYFDVTVFSCSVGLMKPDNRIFYLAAEELDIKPDHCLYVADGMDGELKAAAAVGMTPVRISFPHANQTDPYLEDWYGTTISSLSEIMDLVK
jgi:putative hydrolase of the HAD superfamily